MIETLPLLTPDPQRSERTIARSHEQLARRHKRAEAARTNTRYLAVERAIIGGLCVIYISGVALVAIQVLMDG